MICRVENVPPGMCVGDTSVANALMRMLNALAQLRSGNTKQGQDRAPQGLTLKS
jgi:hypothetical protein